MTQSDTAPVAGDDAPNIPILTTQRLQIRPLRLDDLDACHRLNRDVGWTDPARSDAENRARRASWLDWTVASYRELERLHQPPIGERAVVDRLSGDFVGMVGLVPCLAPFDQLPSRGAVENARTTAELGLFWAISPARQKQGLASEAAAALIDYAFTVRYVARLVATTEYDNPASIAVMRRLGMTIERNPYPDPFYLQVVGQLNAGDRR